MARPGDLMRGERNRHRLTGGGNGIFVGEIRSTATSVDDTVRVKVPSFSNTHIFSDECKFMPRVDDAGDTVLPSTGDPCVITLAEDNVPGTPMPVITWWEPS